MDIRDHCLDKRLDFSMEMAFQHLELFHVPQLLLRIHRCHQLKKNTLKFNDNLLRGEKSLFSYLFSIEEVEGHLLKSKSTSMVALVLRFRIQAFAESSQFGSLTELNFPVSDPENEKRG